MNIAGTFSISYSVQESLSWGLVADSPVAADSGQATFANGSSYSTAPVIDLHWESQGVTLAAGASTTLTLSALTDGLNRSVAFVHVVVFYLRITTITPGDSLTLGPGATHGWTALSAGSSLVRRLLLAADDTGGWAVAAGSNDQVTISNTGSHSITFNIGISGTSA